MFLRFLGWNVVLQFWVFELWNQTAQFYWGSSVEFAIYKKIIYFLQVLSRRPNLEASLNAFERWVYYFISSIVTMTLSTLGALMLLVLISSWNISGGFLALVPVLMRQQIRVHPTNIFVLLINCLMCRNFRYLVKRRPVSMDCYFFRSIINDSCFSTSMNE